MPFDTDTERELQARFELLKKQERISRIVARLREVKSMTPEQYQQWRSESAAAVRKANCEFCRKHPDQCQP